MSSFSKASQVSWESDGSMRFIAAAEGEREAKLSGQDSETHPEELPCRGLCLGTRTPAEKAKPHLSLCPVPHWPLGVSFSRRVHGGGPLWAVVRICVLLSE